MEYRGPILIVFALSLIASPIAIKLHTDPQEEAVTPTRVQTLHAAQEQCEAESFRTQNYVIGCKAHEEAAVQRIRMDNGGALFVAARTR